MDPYPSILFARRDDGTAYDQQMHGLLGDPPQIPSTSTAHEASYQIPSNLAMADEARANNDVSMGHYDMGPSMHGAPLNARSSCRARNEQLDWDAHKDMIKKLYLDQNKSLSETMEAMKEQHSFHAS